METDVYYTVSRVTALLRLYPYLADSRPPKDPELAGIAKRAFGPGGWGEEAQCKRADIYRAILWLHERSPEAAYVIRANVIVGLPLRAARDYLMRVSGCDIHHETVRRWKIDGIIMMSGYLRDGEVRAR